jgi:hypothetical protein
LGMDKTSSCPPLCKYPGVTFGLKDAIADG